MAPKDSNRTLTFTAKWVERTVPIPEEGRVDWYDDKDKGLGLRVSSSGKKVWFIQYRIKGDLKRRRLTLDPFPLMSLADARDRAKAVLADASRGLDPAGQKQEERQAPTFRFLAEEYIERYAKGINAKTGTPRKRSWKKDEDAIKRDLLPAWGHRKAKDIKKRDVNAVLDVVASRAPIQANRVLALIRKIYNWGISRDLVETNPCAQIPRPSPENKRDRVLSDAEIRAFWTACDTLQSAVAAAFRLRLVTAQRGGEVHTMTWSDVDLDGGWWTIPAGRAKNKNEHRVPLSALAKAILEDLKGHSKGSPWVFPSRMKPDEPIQNPHASAKKLRSTMTEMLGMEREIEFDLHDLRRTAASNMASIQVPRLVISRVLNHAEGGVTAIYDRYGYDMEKRDALIKWASKIEVLIGKV